MIGIEVTADLADMILSGVASVVCYYVKCYANSAWKICIVAVGATRDEIVANVVI